MVESGVTLVNFIPFNISKQGATHILNNKECQDVSKSVSNGNNFIAVVCDGHGGEDYTRSRYGAEIGCDVAVELLNEFLNSTSKEDMRESAETKLEELQENIVTTWKCKVKKHSKTKKFTEEELEKVSENMKSNYISGINVESAYGTTLIVVGVKKDYWVGLHIGDGKCVAVNPEGKFVQPILSDPRCFLNSTTSLSSKMASSNFRNFYSEKLPVAVFLSSDGIDDCFSTNESLNNFYKTILYSFSKESIEEAIVGLAEYLPRLSAKGSGDDVSLSAILNIDLIGEIEEVKNYNVEYEKARLKKYEKQQKEKFEAEKTLYDAKFQKTNVEEFSNSEAERIN